MLAHLIESKPHRTARRPGGAIASFVVHYGLVLLVIFTSAEAATVERTVRAEAVRFVTPEKPKPVEQPAPELVVAPRPVRVAVDITAPIDIPNVLPAIDLSAPRTDPEAFTSRQFSAAPRTLAPAADSGDGQQVHFDFQVERQVTMRAGSPGPVYPDILRQAGVEGETLVSFVVDTSGRAVPGSFTVVRSTHELFTAAVRNALPRMRFVPAEVGEKKVAQLVQQPFSFSIAK
jgi:protein TonB